MELRFFWCNRDGVVYTVSETPDGGILKTSNLSVYQALENLKKKIKEENYGGEIIMIIVEESTQKKMKELAS